MSQILRILLIALLVFEAILILPRVHSREQQIICVVSLALVSIGLLIEPRRLGDDEHIRWLIADAMRLLGLLGMGVGLLLRAMTPPTNE